jgi:hypothetical protein
MFRFILCILLFIPLASFSHSGHDHSAPMASFIHLLWIAPALIVAAFLLKKLIHNK